MAKQLRSWWCTMWTVDRLHWLVSLLVDMAKLCFKKNTFN